MLDTNVTILGLLIFATPLIAVFGFLLWSLYNSLKGEMGIIELRSKVEVTKSEKRLCDMIANCFGQLQCEVEDLKRNRKETK